MKKLRPKNYRVLIHVKKVLQYYPLSRENMPVRANRDRLLEIQEMGEAYRVSEDDVVLAFGYYLGYILKERIKESIKTQKIGRERMRRIYAPLSKEYRQTKRYANRNKFWIDTGNLVKHITVWKMRKKIFVGVKKDKETDIIFWLEMGTRKIPARPLLRPLVKMIRKSVGEYWGRFSELVGDGKIRLKPLRVKL